MKFVNDRKFSLTATKLLRDEKRNKAAVAEALLEEAESLLKKSGITESDVLKALAKVRKKGNTPLHPSY